MIPDTFLGRLWTRLTRCWIIGHTPPLSIRWPSDRYGNRAAGWECDRCGWWVNDTPESLEFPDPD